MVIGLGGYLIYDNFVKGDSNDEEGVSVSEYKGLTEIDASKYDNIWNCKDDNGCSCFNNTINVKTEGEEIEFYISSGSYFCIEKRDEKYLLYLDNNKIKLYDSIKDKYYIVNIDMDYDRYELISDPETNEIYGIVYYNNDLDNRSESYYSIKSDATIYEGYTHIYYLHNGYLGARYYSKSPDNVYTYILDINKNKILMEENEKLSDYALSYINSYIYIGNYILLQGCLMSNFCPPLKVYTQDLKEIASDFDSLAFDNNENVLILKDGKITTYDENGNVVSESNKAGKILDLFSSGFYAYSDYMVYLDSNEIKILKEDEEIVTLGTFDESNDKLYSVYYYDGEFEVEVINKNIILDEGWDACINNNKYYLCFWESKEEGYSYAYSYKYNLKTKHLTKSIEEIYNY